MCILYIDLTVTFIFNHGKPAFEFDTEIIKKLLSYLHKQFYLFLRFGAFGIFKPELALA